MELLELLEALSGNEKLYVSLAELSGTKLITFNAPGYTSVENDLGSRTVDSIKIDSTSSVEITLKATP